MAISEEAIGPDDPRHDEPKTDDHRIDETDRKIIAVLARNGRRSYRDVARMLNVSEGMIRQRVTRLIDKELIRVTVVGNLLTLGVEVVAMVLIQVKPGHSDAIARKLTEYPHVRFVATSLGPTDILMQTLHHDLQSLHNFVSNELPRAAPNITSINTLQLSNVLKSTWTWGDWFEM